MAYKKEEIEKRCVNCKHYKPMCDSKYTFNTGETHACFVKTNHWVCKGKNDSCNDFNLK